MSIQALKFDAKTSDENNTYTMYEKLLSERWLKNNYNQNLDKIVTITSIDGKEQNILLKRFYWFYCIDSKTYNDMLEEEFIQIFKKYPNEYFCVIRNEHKNLIHFTKASKDQIEKDGLLASSGEETTLADGIYCFDSLYKEPEKIKCNYIKIDFEGPYFECIYDPDPGIIDGRLVGKDGYEYNTEEHVVGSNGYAKTEFAAQYQEILLPVYEISFDKLQYHEFNKPKNNKPTES